MPTGVHGEYQWLEVEHKLSEFLGLCPEAILGAHVVITAVDSGSFVPSATDRANGWTDRDGLAYSPRIRSTAELPANSHGRECCGFDEWYVFDSSPAHLGTLSHDNVFTTELVPGTVFAFVNFGGFVLSDTGMKAITDLFWRQLEWMQPKSYLGDGQKYLIFATRNAELFVSVPDALGQNTPRA